MKKFFSLFLIVLITVPALSQTVNLSIYDGCLPTSQPIQIDGISGLQPQDEVTLRITDMFDILADTTNILSNFSFPFILETNDTVFFPLVNSYTVSAFSSGNQFFSYTYNLWPEYETLLTDTSFVECNGSLQSEYIYTTYQSIHGCDSVVQQWQEVVQHLPEICIVTDTNGYNSVIFEKNALGTGVDYIIYRNLDSIGVVSVGDTSVFVDTTANNFTQSYSYSIRANSIECGLSQFSPEHQTIHLQENLGLNDQANLSWTHYVGFDISDLEYSVQRTRGGITDELAIIPTGNSPTYTDFTFQLGDEYVIVLASPYVCSPSSGKRDAGLMSKSNRIAPGSTGISDGTIDLGSVYSYDKQITGSLTEGLLTVYTSTGQIVTTDNLSGKFNIPISTPGIYIVTVATENAFGSTKVFVQ